MVVYESDPSDDLRNTYIVMTANRKIYLRILLIFLLIGVSGILHAENKETDSSASDLYWDGGEKADIVITEYIDFECGYCKENHAHIQYLLKTHGKLLKLEIKHLPLRSPRSYMMAAYYESIKLHSNEAAKTFHDIVLVSQEYRGINAAFWDDEQRAAYEKRFKKRLDAAVIASGANLDQVHIDWTSEEIQELIQQDIDEAEELGGDSTPFFVINGIAYTGFQDFNSLVSTIKSEREKK